MESPNTDNEYKDANALSTTETQDEEEMTFLNEEYLSDDENPNMTKVNHHHPLSSSGPSSVWPTKLKKAKILLLLGVLMVGVIFSFRFVFPEFSTWNRTSIETNRTYSYPTYLVILKSSRVGSTFFKETLRKEYPGHIYTHWEGDLNHARLHFEKCETLCQESIEVNNGKCACSVHLNDVFRDTNRLDAMNDMVRDFNASVVFQVRANAIEKGISMSKRWGLMQEKYHHYSETSIAQDIKKRAIQTLNFNRAVVHADDKNLLALPSPTQDKALWVWYEDLVNSCAEKFGLVFEEIGMGHLPLPEACDTMGFRDEGPYKDEWVREFSDVPALVPMIDHYKYNMEVDTDAVYEEFAKETANITGPIVGVGR